MKNGYEFNENLSSITKIRRIGRKLIFDLIKRRPNFGIFQILYVSKSLENETYDLIIAPPNFRMAKKNQFNHFKLGICI